MSAPGRLVLLWVASRLAWRGGIGRVVAGGARALAARGHAVHVAGSAPDGDPGPLAGAAVHPWPVRRLKLAQLADLIPLVRTTGAHVVHFHSAMPHGEVIAGLRALGPAVGRPLVVVTPHSSRPYTKRRARLGLRAADCVAAPSAWAAAHATAAGARRDTVAVVPAGVELAPPSGPATRERVVLAMGRLVAAKGLDRLVDAFAAAARDRPAWRLVIAGTGPEAAALAARARTLPCADRIELPGWLEGEAKARALSRASIGAVPSERESFGGALLEMQAWGLACVAADAGGLAELADGGHAARLVPAGDVAALAAALASLMDDAPARDALAAAGRRHAAGYGWDAIAARTEALYRQALAARR